jgi:hypothetical protein
MGFDSDCIQYTTDNTRMENMLWSLPQVLTFLHAQPSQSTLVSTWSYLESIQTRALKIRKDYTQESTESFFLLEMNAYVTLG